MRDETWEVQLATTEPFLLFYISIVMLDLFSAPLIVWSVMKRP